MSNNFFDEILIVAVEAGSLYSGSLNDRRALIVFMDQNDLLNDAGFPRMKKEEIISLQYEWIPAGEVMSRLKGRLKLWLTAYRRSDQERLIILCDHGKLNLPDTCRTYREFITSKAMEDRSVSWELLDYLLSVLKEEIPAMSAVGKEAILSAMHDDLPRQHVNLFTSYLDSLADKDQASHITYSIRSEKGSETVTAYTFHEFSAMAYCIFNERYWTDYGLLERACSNQIYANLWVFLAFFFVSGLRGSDVVRTPRPSLPYEGDEFRQRILRGDVSDPGSFARDIVFRMKYRELTPNKTSAENSIPQLKLSIPVSLEKPFGIILSVAASYFPESMRGKPFLKYDCSYRSIRRFFGHPFSDLLDRKSFNIRRANKAYLQAVEIITDSKEDTYAKGYLVAALARSHKGTLATLPETTDIYLKDAEFSGLKPELVLFEMFERGIFGFIPHLLLKACFGEDYQRLNIFSQTDLIGEIGIVPSGIERLVAASSKAMDQAKLVIREIYEQHADISSVLSRIASGEAAARQDNFLCAMTAAGMSCRYPDRRSCITCRYEICTKAALHHLTAEYTRLLERSKDPDDWRSEAIIRAAILPVIQEYLGSIRLMYPDADLSPYHEILQGGLDHYDRLISTDR